MAWARHRTVKTRHEIDPSRAGEGAVYNFTEQSDVDIVESDSLEGRYKRQVEGIACDGGATDTVEYGLVEMPPVRKVARRHRRNTCSGKDDQAPIAPHGGRWGMGPRLDAERRSGVVVEHYRN